MKLKNMLWLAIVILVLAACKKENPIMEPEAALELLKDSLSYTVNGKKYVSSEIGRGSTFTTQSNTKITSGINFNYLIQGGYL